MFTVRELYKIIKEYFLRYIGLMVKYRLYDVTERLKIPEKGRKGLIHVT